LLFGGVAPVDRVAIYNDTLMRDAVSLEEEDRNHFGFIYKQPTFAVPIVKVLKMNV